MNGLKSDVLLLQKRTYRKIAYLSRELCMKRSRLERFVAGRLAKSDLTVAEYKTLAAHPTFSDLLDRPDDEGRKKFSVGNAVKYKAELRERAMELLGRYILPPFLAVAHSTLREPIVARDYDLLFVFEVNTLHIPGQNLSGDLAGLATATNMGASHILFDAEDAKIFHDYLDELCAEDDLVGDDVLIQYFACYQSSEQYLWRNIYATAPAIPQHDQLKLDFDQDMVNG